MRIAVLTPCKGLPLDWLDLDLKGLDFAPLTLQMMEET